MLKLFLDGYEEGYAAGLWFATALPGEQHLSHDRDVAFTTWSRDTVRPAYQHGFIDGFCDGAEAMAAVSHTGDRWSHRAKTAVWGKEDLPSPPLAIRSHRESADEWEDVRGEARVDQDFGPAFHHDTYEYFRWLRRGSLERSFDSAPRQWPTLPSGNSNARKEDDQHNRMSSPSSSFFTTSYQTNERVGVPPTMTTIRSSQAARTQSEDSIFSHGGPMSTFMRGVQWEASPFGPIREWPPCLRAVLSLAVEAQFPAVIFWGPQLRMLYNDAYVSILTDKHPTSFARPASEGWPEVWSRIGPMLESVFATGEATNIEDMLVPIIRNGTTETHYLTFTASPIRDEAGRVRGVFCPVTETTARKQAEHALRESERRYRVIAELMSDYVYTAHLDAQGNATETKWVSEEVFQRVTGYTREEINAHGGWVTHIVPDDLPALVPARAALLTNQPVTMEYRVVCKDGAVRWLRDTQQPQWDDRLQRVVGIVGAAQDITAQKHAEETQARLVAELQRVNAELQQFAYIVSHDLSEPLRTMHNYIKLIAQQTEGKLDGTTEEDLTFVMSAAQRMQQILTDLLAYTRAGHTPAFTAVDCEELVAQVEAALEMQISECGARLTHDPLPIIQGDATRLRQVLQNLIGNAVKFRHPETPLQVHISARREQEHWKFSIRDNGIGIDPAHSERIFQIFQRLHTPSEYPGTGIGLAICKRIVEQHGGNIWVESNPREGAIFHFTIRDI